MTHITGITLPTNQINTGSCTTLNLVLKARSRTVSKHTIFTLANEKGFLQKVQTGFDCTHIWEWTIVGGFFSLGTPMQANTGKVVPTGYHDIGV